MRSKKLLNILTLFALTLGAAGYALAQSGIPPFPTGKTAMQVVQTMWPVAYGAQATNAAQSTQIAALQTAIAKPSTPAPTAQATATKTATPIATANATATTQPGPTATMMPMPTPGGSCINCVTVVQSPPNPVPNIRGLTCPTWAHDLWLVTAPNGKLYRTWHPSIQPDNLPGAGCVYDHTHGPRDPRDSHADNTLPAYGYVADLHGMGEPHVGFKTEFQNAGECNVFEGFCSTSDVRATFHQGTLGAGRVAQRMHTLEFDLRNVSNGAEVHVKGMGDTGFASNQCVPADQVDQEQGTIGVRFFAMPKPLADSCGVGTPYEVWEWALDVGHDNRIHAKLGTFDAITVLNPANGLLESTSATWPNAPFGGCKQDAYFGPVYLSNNMDEVDMHGLRQIIKRGNVANFPLDTVGKSAFKNSFDNCESGATYTDN